VEHYTEAKAFQDRTLALRHEGKRIGFVPTMGYLHEGHRLLMRLAREHADVVIVSLFVNPTQFGPGEDLASYPRDLLRDNEACRAEGVDVLFHPEPGEMYAPDHSLYVVEETLSLGLCGATRPTHFRGVCTVCTKLFNLAQPHTVVMGEKDFQQLQVIRRLVRDLNVPIRVIGAPIVREPDGLAMSSRNRYLSPSERAQALCLHRALETARAAFSAGERRVPVLKEAMRAVIADAPAARIDYMELVDADTLEPREAADTGTRAILAVYVGSTRLIDNAALAGPGGV